MTWLRAAWVALCVAPSFLSAIVGCGARTGLPVPEVSDTVKVRIGTLKPVTKVDLLLVIDNSPSMTDKQSELGRRMPQLIKAITNADPDPKTGKPKVRQVLDLHVGVITSSLGSHGTSACDPSVTNPANDDRAHLLPRPGEGGGTGWVVKTDGAEPVPAECPAPIASSALTWVFDAASDPKARFKGSAQNEQMQAATSCVVQSAREIGCGYEETWEAMVHFLVDPAPYAEAKVKCTFGVSGDACGNNKIEVRGVDEELLAQRRAFLRPDSLLAVVILSDENDQSLKPGGLNWIPLGYGAGQMQRGWAACESVPDDFEPETAAELEILHTKYACFSCFENSTDPNCKVPWAKDKLNNDVDGRNIRNFHQVQRFGYSFYWSRQRYVDAFTKPTFPASDGKLAANPILTGGRTGDMIIVAAIVGVPRLLVANTDGTPKNLGDADWAKISGPIAQRDPHMIESIEPRTDHGIKKYAGDRSIDPVNGGDRDITDGDDLQYACIAKRSTRAKSNDCEGPTPENHSPLCDPGGEQPYFKAYPGLRHARIIQALGPLGYLASICADDYSSTVRGIIERVQVVVDGQCLRTKLAPDASGGLPCVLFESFATSSFAGKARCEEIAPGYCTPGALACRQGTGFSPQTPFEASKLRVSIASIASDGSVREDETQAFSENENVYAFGADGKKHLICEVARVPSTEEARCRTEEAFTPSAGAGWCFTTSPALVTDLCVRFGSTGKLRLFGSTQPHEGSELFAQCK